MANKTVLQIEGRFDPSQILNSLKQIRAEMGKAGAKDSLFSGVDKELENAKKLLTNFMATMSQGVSNSKDIDKLNKEFDNLCKSLAKASTGMKTVAGESKNFNVNGPEIAKLQKTLEQATEAKKKLEESAKAALQTQMSALKLNEGQQKAILKEINDQAKLEEAIKKVGKAKEQTYNQKFQQYVSGNSAAQTKTAEIAGRPGQSSEYVTALTEAVQKGHTLAQLGEKMKSIWTAANIPLADQEKYLDQIAEDYKSIVDAAYNTSSNQQKGQITQQINKYQNLGTTGADGNFQLNTTGQNMVNAVDFNAMAEATHQAAEAQKELNDRTSQAAQANQDYATSATNSLNEVEEEQRQVTEGFHNTTEAQKEAMTAQEDLNKTFDGLKDTVKRVLSLSSAFSGFKRVITETFNDVKKLDSAFKSIALVTNKTVSELWSSYGDYAEMANKLGQSTENAIKSSALFYQQGLDTAEALTLTEDTMKLATLSGQGFEEATKQMTAALRGFHMEMEQGSHITDVYSELAANAAADVHGIAYAMSKTASIANSAGMSFENTAAFLTNMIETTQEAPENIGTAMKTIIARFTELKENVSAADSEFDDLDYNKVDKALKSVGINLKDTNGQFRNLDDVFLELSSKWSTLDRNTQRYIATTAAGSRQQSRFIAMMEDYGRTMELVETAQNSAGRSEEQFAKYADTLEYKINALKNTWEQLRMSLLDSDMFKGLIDGFNNFLGKVGKLDFKKLIPLGVAMIPMIKNMVTTMIKAAQSSTGDFAKVGNIIATKIGGGISKAFKNTKMMKTIASTYGEKQKEVAVQIEKANAKIKQAEESLQQFKAQNDTKIIESTERLVQRHKEELEKLKQQEAALIKQTQVVPEQIGRSVMSIASSAAMAIGLMISGGSLEDSLKAMGTMVLTQTATMGMEMVAKWALSLAARNAATVAADAALVAQSGATGVEVGAAMDAGLAATGAGLIIVAITAALGFLFVKASGWVKKYKENHKSLEEQLAESEERLKDLDSQAKQSQAQAKESKQTYEEADKLKKKYEELHNMRVRTTEQEQEYQEIIKQIQDEMPEIVSYYDEQNQKLIVQNDLWEKILKNQKELHKEDAKNAAMDKAAEIAGMESKDNAQIKYNKEQNEKLPSRMDILTDAINSYEYRSMSEESRETSLKDMAQKYNIQLTDLMIKNLSKIGETIVTSDGNREGFVKWKTEIEDYGDGDTERYTTYISEEYKKIYDEIMSYNDALYSKEIDNEDEYHKLRIENNKTYAKDTKDYSDAVAEVVANMAENESITLTGSEQSNILHGIKSDAKGVNDLNAQEKEAYYAKKASAEQLKAIDNIEISETLQDSINSYAEKIGEMTTADMQKKRTLLENLAGPESERQAVIDWLTSFNEKYKEAREKINEAYSIDTSDWTNDQVAVIDNVLDSLATKYDDSKAKTFMEKALGLKEAQNLDMSTFTDLMSLDWGDVDVLNIDEFKDNLKDKLIDSGVPEDNAEQFGEAWAKAAQDSMIMNLSSANIESVGEKLLTKMEAKIDGMDKISKVIQSQFENGVISFAESKTLEKELEDMGMKAADYLSTATDGSIIFDTEKFKEDLLGESDAMDTLIDQVIEENQEKIAQLELENQLCLKIIDRINGEDAVIGKLEEEAALMASMGLIDSNYKKGSHDKTQINELNARIRSNEEQIQQYKDDIAKYQDKNSEEYKNLQEKYLQRYKALSDSFDTAEKAGTKAATDNAKKLEDAAKKIAEAEKKVEEATKKLNETLYGTEYHKNAADPLYNYTTNLERLEKKAEDAKEALEDLGHVGNSKENMDAYLSNTHASIVNRQAQNRILQQDVDNRKAILDSKFNAMIAELNASGNGRNMSTDINDYYTQVGDRFNINFSAINNAQFGDDAKDYLQETIQTMNDDLDKMEDNMDEIKKKEKELRDFRKKMRDDYIKLEQKVVDTLKEKYEEEIKNNEDKNKALEEADNAYLDALKKNIDKQRKLRDEANAWEDLAEQQKKLSLMQRDTSGANQKEVKKLQKDVKKTQQDLLDKGVDRIVEELKELYDAQKETRELEIEYQKAVIDNAQLIKEANDLINSWKGPEDMYEFMMTNTKSLSEMSQAQIEAEQEEWSELFDAKGNYMAATAEDFSNALITQEDEIVDVVKNTSEVLTQEADRSLGEIKTKIQEAIESAEKALEDAIQGLADARNSYNELSSSSGGGSYTPLSTGGGSSNASNGGSNTFSVENMPGAARNEYEKSEVYQLSKAISELKVDDPTRSSVADLLNKLEDIAKHTAAKSEPVKTELRNKAKSLLSKSYGIGNTFDESKYSILNKFKNFSQIMGLTHNPSSPGGYFKYKTGGLVDYTGPAWVDGTPNKPEAFLSPEDTQRIGLAAKLLASLPVFNYGSTNNAVSSNVGDTSIEIHINVDSLGSDYDVDQLVERVKNDIVDIARPTGTPVILNKR